MVKSNLCFQGEHPRGHPGVKLHDTNSIACVSRHPTARWPPWWKVTRHRQYNLCISTPDSAMATSGMTSGMTLGLRSHTAVLGDNLNFCQGRKIRKQSYVLGSARLIWLWKQFVLNSNCVARAAQACRRGWRWGYTALNIGWEKNRFVPMSSKYRRALYFDDIGQNILKVTEDQWGYLKIGDGDG